MQVVLDKEVTGGGDTGWFWAGSYAKLLVRALPTSGTAYWEHNTTQSSTGAIKWAAGDVATGTEDSLRDGAIYLRGVATGNCKFEIAATIT